MEKNNRFLLFVVFIILLILAAFNLNRISGKVIGYTADDVKIEIRPKELIFDRYDNSHVVNVLIDSGDIGVDKKYILREANSGYKEAEESLCENSICDGKRSDNFLIRTDIASGDYYFEFTRDCLSKFRPYLCNSINEPMRFRSEILTIRHV